MRLRTLVVLGIVLGGLATAPGASLATSEQVTLQETWVSDTARENRVNDHAIGVGQDGASSLPSSTRAPSRFCRDQLDRFVATSAMAGAVIACVVQFAARTGARHILVPLLAFSRTSEQEVGPMTSVLTTAATGATDASRRAGTPQERHASSTSRT